MIFDIKPIANIFPIAVNRQRLSLQGIENNQRNEFFRELIWAIIIRTVGYCHRQEESFIVGAHQMVGSRLGRGIWAVGTIWSVFAEKAFGAETAVNLIGADMVKEFEFIFAGCGYFQKIKSSDNIGLDKITWSFYGAVNMRFSGKVADGINIILRKYLFQFSGVTNIHLLENIP